MTSPSLLLIWSPRTLKDKFLVVMVAVIVVTILSLLALRLMDKVSLFHFYEREHLRAVLSMKQLLSYVEQKGVDANAVRKDKVVELIDDATHIAQQKDVELMDTEQAILKAIGFRELLAIPDDAIANANVMRKKLLASAEPLITPALLEDIRENVNRQLDYSLRFGPLNRELAIFVRNVVLMIAALNFILLVVPVMLLRRSVVDPLQQAISTTNQVAQGDLTSRIHFERKDEVGELFSSLSSMNESLRGIVVRVRGASERVAQQSHDLLEGNQIFAQRIVEQSATLEELASVIEEFTAAVQRTAEHSQEVSAAATEANDLATNGGSAMRELMQAMGDIAKNVGQSQAVIDVIDSIAFQTNILALNAAVEAARAGEQGRGFAVVAQEVRALAQRCSTSSKEIKALIGTSLEQVNVGTQLAGQVGSKIENVLAANGKVHRLVSEITGAIHEQSRGIAEVNLGITNIDKVTQQNVELVEKASMSSEAMNAEAASLREVVQVFRLGDRSDAVRSEPAALQPQPALASERPHRQPAFKPRLASASTNAKPAHRWMT